jgi:deferrochelatase/peroxidase EfeB
MIAPPESPQKADVQRLVVRGYTLNRSRHFVLQVRDPAAARRFLKELVCGRMITNATIDHSDAALLNLHGHCPANIGFSFRGLEALQLDLAYLRVFQEKSPAFAEGAYARAAQRLADTGDSAARCWDECFRPDRAHVLLSIYADEQCELDARARALERLPGAGGLENWKLVLDGCHLSRDRKKRTVHFGFRDGISDPPIEGFPEREPTLRWPAPKAHAAGEFLLGYANDEGFNPWLLVNPSTLPNPWLPPSARVDAGFFRNGSFAAFRKIEQHEREFRAFVSLWATKFGVSEEYVRAKLVGRWDDGHVVQPGEECPPAPPRSPEARRKDDTRLNDFDFSIDREGEGCPFGAHIRRMNPRADPVVPFRRRPLARRGMPYGPPYEPASAARRGLLGLFFCASLEDQFEHLLGQWGNANPMGPDNRGTAKDPIIGNHEDPAAMFDIPMAGESLRPISGFAPLVATRGTLYAFYPGLKALRKIAGIDTSACHET